MLWVSIYLALENKLFEGTGYQVEGEIQTHQDDMPWPLSLFSIAMATC